MKAAENLKIVFISISPVRDLEKKNVTNEIKYTGLYISSV